MDRAEIERAFQDVLDQAIVFHGFADYMRDYDLYLYATADPRTLIQPEHLRYRFTHCVRAAITTAVAPGVWADSLDDRLTDYDLAMECNLGGYVWGVKWQALYPGMTLLTASPDANRWSTALGCRSTKP